MSKRENFLIRWMPFSAFRVDPGLLKHTYAHTNRVLAGPNAQLRKEMSATILVYGPEKEFCFDCWCMNIRPLKTRPFWAHTYQALLSPNLSKHIRIPFWDGRSADIGQSVGCRSNNLCNATGPTFTTGPTLATTLAFASGLILRVIWMFEIFQAYGL